MHNAYLIRPTCDSDLSVNGADVSGHEPLNWGSRMSRILYS
jgi:hypothetical protein